MDEYIDINEVAKAKGLKSTRSLRISINKNKYIARKKKSERGGGETYEILLVSLEPKIQEHITIEYLLFQTVKPDKLILWLADSQ